MGENEGSVLSAVLYKHIVWSIVCFRMGWDGIDIFCIASASSLLLTFKAQRGTKDSGWEMHLL